MRTVLLRLLLLPAFLLVVSAARASDIRFSNTLKAEDKAAAGIGRLTSDQVAALDALVRRDTAVRGSTPAPRTQAEAAPAEFSRRLTADERRVTGLASLAAEEVGKVDALVDRHQTAALARTFLAPPEYLSPTRRLLNTEKKPERRVHGSFSLSYGFGSGGYSEKTGSMVITIDDPARNMSLSIGYSQSHIKGGPAYIYRDPLYDNHRRGPDLREPGEP
jgi:hypothetical protein